VPDATSIVIYIERINRKNVGFFGSAVRPNIRGHSGTLARARDILRQHVESSGPMTASEWDWTLRVIDRRSQRERLHGVGSLLRDGLIAARNPEDRRAHQGTCSSAWTDFTNLNVMDRRPPTTNLHLCFYARSKEQVDAFYRAGVEAGFRSNGAPGYRDYGPGYYAAYLLDPDGNNVEALYRDVGNIGHGVSAALH